MSTVDVTGDYVVSADQNLTLDISGEMFPAGFVLSDSASLVIDGSVLIEDSDANQAVTGIYVDPSSAELSLKIAAGGSLTVTALGVGSGAYGIEAGNGPFSFENDGTFTANGTGLTTLGGGLFLNTGTINVTGDTGLFYDTAGTITNTGSIYLTNYGDRGIAALNFGGGTIVNSGLISVTGSGSYPTVGLQVGGLTGQVETVSNSGTITAQYAIQSGAFVVSNSVLNLRLDNTGTINGEILLSNETSSQIHNTGAINGNISFGNGEDLYDGVGGTLTIGVFLGGGHDTVYLGNDGETVYGGAGSATIVGGTGNDIIVGGSGAFTFAPGGGSDTVENFSVQNDAVDLPAFFSLANVLAASTQSGADTVINLGGGSSLTLVGVQMTALTASDFVFAPVIVTSASQVITIGSGINLSVADTSTVAPNTAGAIVQYEAGGTVINDGVLSVTGVSTTSTTVGVYPNDGVSYASAVFRNEGQLSVSSPDSAGIQAPTVENSGSLTVTGTTTDAVGVYGDLTNSGTITVQAVAEAEGVQDNSQTGLVQNLANGVLSVSSTAGGPATGVIMYGGEFDNAGALQVSGAFLSIGVYVAGQAGNTTSYPVVNNSGQITTIGAGNIGIEYLASENQSLVQPHDIVPAGQYNLINSGAITATTAIDAASSDAAAALDNGGVINGAVNLSAYDDVLVNTGTINGAVDLGGGDDTLTSSGGKITGVVTLGAAAGSVVTLGAEDNTVVLSSGTATVDGGGGTNTVSFAGATEGTYFSFAAEGHAEVTRVGTYTLSNFQAVIGSAYDDILIAGTGNETFTGGGGENVFEFSPGAGADVVTDFSDAQGDRISLSTFTGLHTFADYEALLSQSGANTVISLPGGGTITLDNMQASSLTPANFGLVSAIADFTGSGSSDVVWQNSSGQVATWGVSGASVAGALVSTAAPGWQLEDTGDFNGDGLSGDLLFRNPTTGQVAIWEMNGTQIVSAAIVASVPAAWSVEGTGDFNGDGKSDIVLHDGATGQVAIWEMNGTSIAASAIVATAPVAWSLVGSGDFNGDGKSDLLWENGSTGQLAIWEMNGLTIASAGNVITVPTGWHVEGTGDFDGDGRSDIVLESASGQVAIWEMNGMSIAGAAIVATPGSAWQVAQVGDFNGDGKADILLHDAATGQNAVWDMNGTAIASAALLPNVDASWTALNHHYDWV